MTDSNWLKIALQLNGRGGATELAAEQPLAETTAYWVHLDYTREESEQWLRRQSIPQAVIDSLTAAETRPRASEVAGGVLVYLRGVNLNPGARPEDMIALRMWVGPRGLVSSQKRSLLSVDAVKGSLDSEQGPASISALVAELVDQLIWRMEEVIENLESEVESCALQLEEAPRSSLTPQLSLLRRRAITLRRYLAPQREALIKLQNESLFAAADTMLIVPAAGVSDRPVRYQCGRAAGRRGSACFLVVLFRRGGDCRWRRHLDAKTPLVVASGVVVDLPLRGLPFRPGGRSVWARSHRPGR